MAMLAERRERRRYNLVPRGKALYEDENRFGTRMLEKMGWTKGKGLGANEDGAKDFVRIRYKHDNEGMGFEDRNDQWTEHAKTFDNLLETLNNKKLDDTREEDLANEDVPTAVGFGFQTEMDPLPKVSLSGESLEEKSKKSRARVHYMKFTRGKDISRYSVKDLANIFGKKSLANETSGAEDDSVAKTTKKTSQIVSDDETKQPTFGVTTICKGTSINDYFKAKMDSLRSKFKTNGNQCSENSDPEVCKGQATDNDEQTLGISKKDLKRRKHEMEAKKTKNGVTEDDKVTCEETNSFKKKKKKTNVENTTEMILTESKLSGNADLETSNEANISELPNNEQHEFEKPRKRQKKRKQEIEVDETSMVENCVTENICPIDANSNGTSEDASNFKKKKEKLITEKFSEVNLTDGNSNNNLETELVVSKKKSKQKCKIKVENKDFTDHQMGEDNNEIFPYEENKTKLEKKSKKKSKQDVADGIKGECKLVEKIAEKLTIENCKVKKSKRKTEKESTSNMSRKEEIEALTVLEIANSNDLASDNDNSSCQAKKRNTSSIQSCDPSTHESTIPLDEETPKKKKNKSIQLLYIETSADLGAPETCLSGEVTAIETKKSKKAKLEVEPNEQLTPFATDSNDVTENSFELKKSKKKSKSKSSNGILGNKSIEFEQKLQLTGDSIENIAQLDNNNILKLPTDSMLSVQEPIVVAQTATTVVSVPNEFKFPELIRRKRKKKQNAPQDATPTEKSAQSNPNAIAQPEEESDYKLNGFTAEKFFNVDINGFPGSNFPLIIGYGLSGRLKIEINHQPSDELKIQKFYAREFDKLQKLENKKHKKHGFKPKAVENTSFPANLV